jgi:hypothetical protein
MGTEHDHGWPCPCGRSFTTKQGRGLHQKKCSKLQQREVQVVSNVEMKSADGNVRLRIASVTISGDDDAVNAGLQLIQKLMGGGG